MRCWLKVRPVWRADDARERQPLAAPAAHWSRLASGCRSDVLPCSRNLSAALGTPQPPAPPTAPPAGYTAPGLVAVEAHSAGGLAAGALLNRRAGALGAALLEAPFVDALSAMSQPGLPLTVHEYEEWGDPSAGAAQFEQVGCGAAGAGAGPGWAGQALACPGLVCSGRLAGMPRVLPIRRPPPLRAHCPAFACHAGAAPVPLPVRAPRALPAHAAHLLRGRPAGALLGPAQVCGPPARGGGAARRRRSGQCWRWRRHSRRQHNSSSSSSSSSSGISSGGSGTAAAAGRPRAAAARRRRGRRRPLCARARPAGGAGAALRLPGRRAWGRPAVSPAPAVRLRCLATDPGCLLLDRIDLTLTRIAHCPSVSHILALANQQQSAARGTLGSGRRAAGHCAAVPRRSHGALLRHQLVVGQPEGVRRNRGCSR